MKLRSGSIVFNQDSNHPMCGEVISHIGRDVEVKWTDGTICVEYVSNLILTADVEFEHAGNVTSARTDIQDAISVINELRADHVQAIAKIDQLLTKLCRVETQLFVAAQPVDPRTVRLSDGTFEYH